MIISDLHVVLVSENIEGSEKGSSSLSRTREMSDKRVTSDLVSALNQICRKVDICKTPKELFNYSGKDVFIMTIYGGAISRNRMSLVPAICEAIGLKYAGADAYGRFLCQDKYLTKQFIKDFDIATPNCVLIRNESEIALISTLTPPLVVKPNLEGSSIGIDERNLTASISEAANLTIELLSQFNQPIIVEEFCSGKEVCICIIGTKDEIVHFETVEDVHETDPNLLLNKLFSANLKRGTHGKMNHKLISEIVSDSDKKKFKEVFFSMGKIDYLRIDCRIKNNKCHLIELTPDPYMAKRGSFGESCTLSNTSYEQGIRMILESSLKNYQIPYSSEP